MQQVLYVAHRINTIDELMSVPRNYGVEIDLRDHKDTVVLSHDPFNLKHKVKLENYMKYYNHAFIILNIKSEGIEYKIQKIMENHSITNYFFLDSSFPMITKLLHKNERNIAIRYSEYESIDIIRKLDYKPKFVWVDCFSSFPLTLDDYIELLKHKVIVCCVSPELQGQSEKLEKYKEEMRVQHIVPSMICTKLKNIKRWM